MHDHPARPDDNSHCRDAHVACRLARVVVESTETSQQIMLAASAAGSNASSTRLEIPSACQHANNHRPATTDRTDRERRTRDTRPEPGDPINQLP